jgi:CRISPR/Cas system-associated endoribonuclease Cas2
MGARIGPPFEGDLSRAHLQLYEIRSRLTNVSQSDSDSILVGSSCRVRNDAAT